MNHDGGADIHTRLADAERTIARQEQELAQLQSQLAAESLAGRLQDVFSRAATTGIIAAPVQHKRLLEMIVQTAAHVIHARSASLFLLDERAQELVMEYPLGPKAEEVRQLRVPLGRGVAGLVAMNGQPMAVADASSDPRHAADIARMVGYTPHTILCVPLVYNDQTVGVLELLDKLDAPSFSLVDMEALGLFANQAAIAIEQSRSHQNLTALVGDLLESLSAGTVEDERELQQQLRSFAADLDQDVSYRQALELARLVQVIAHQGESELKACQVMLGGFADYLRSRSEPSAELWAVR